MTIDTGYSISLNEKWRKDIESVLRQIKMVEKVVRKRKWQKSRYEKNRGYLCSLTR